MACNISIELSLFDAVSAGEIIASRRGREPSDGDGNDIARHCVTSIRKTPCVT